MSPADGVLLIATSFGLAASLGFYAFARSVGRQYESAEEQLAKQAAKARDAYVESLLSEYDPIRVAARAIAARLTIFAKAKKKGRASRILNPSSNASLAAPRVVEREKA